MIELKTQFSRRELMWFGPLLALFAGLIAMIALWKFDAPGFAKWTGIVAGVLIAIYYIVPPLRRPLFIGWMAVVFPIGWLLSHLLLSIVFYLVVFPIGLLLRLFRYDALKRRFEPEVDSYWIERERREDPKRYFRQF